MEIRYAFSGEPYRISEDTLLLIKGIEHAALGAEFAAEIGCGAGYATEVLAEASREVVATDVNFESARATWLRMKAKGVDGKVHVICCDRLEAVREGEVFDAVVFNPPYLPSEGEDPQFSGGPTGIEVPLAFSSSALSRLKRGGTLLFLLSSLSNWWDALAVLGSSGCRSSILRIEHVGLFEDLLMILCAKR